MRAIALALILGVFGLTTALRADEPAAPGSTETQQTKKVEKKHHGKKMKKGHKVEKKEESKSETKTETTAPAPAAGGAAAPAPEQPTK